jgi:uncharacterized protein YjbJ (UPF0337 family)
MESTNKDEIVGRAKEAAGAILDDEDLRAEGRLDQLAGTLKKKVGAAIDRLKGAVSPGDSGEGSSNQR